MCVKSSGRPYLAKTAVLHHSPCKTYFEWTIEYSLCLLTNWHTCRFFTSPTATHHKNSTQLSPIKSVYCITIDYGSDRAVGFSNHGCFNVLESQSKKKPVRSALGSKTDPLQKLSYFVVCEGFQGTYGYPKSVETHLVGRLLTECTISTQSSTLLTFNLLTSL